MILRSQRVVTPQGVRPASIHVRDGRIERVADFLDVPEGAAVIEHGDLTIMPGVVDSHVHVNEPGRTEWEGFATATRAAAAGGVTTIVDMPLNCIPATTSVAALETKAAAMEGKCRVDVGLWGGAVPGNAAELPEMVRRGALGFKCFLVDSGVPEFRHLHAAGVDEALTALADTNAPLLVHAELGEYLHEIHEPASYRAYLESRPKSAEDHAIQLVYDACALRGAKAHIVHLSSAGGLALVQQARDARVPLTAETTPHYLFFDAESIPDAAPEFKCAPPIREHANRKQLWQGVSAELLTAIVSDHSPCTPELKKLAEGNIAQAWGGISSLQFALPVVWTEARRRGIPLELVSRLMSEGPARLAGIESRKGRLAPGYDADLTVWNPEESFRVEPPMIEHRHKVTPYAGRTLYGKVHATYVRGQIAGDAPIGLWIRR